MREEACAAAKEALPVESIEITAPTPDATVREGEMEGVLHVVGEFGYRAASVRAVLEYSGGHRKQFYEHFDSLEDCFAQAYASWIDRLGVTVLEAAVAADGWRGAVRAGLVALLSFVERRPTLGRALFVEVQVAGGAALAKHDEAVDRLAGLLDGVRSELKPDEQPPETTGAFVVGGVEACLCDALAEGNANRIRDALPELMHMIVGSYFGPAAAEEEFEAAKELLERDRARPGDEGR
jgi:AcrR family transcriptional regulator